MSFLLRACAAGLRASTHLPAPVASTSALPALRRAASTQSQSVAAKKAADAGLFRRYKPINNSLRHLKRPINAHLYAGRPLRGLTIAQRKKGGRGGNGRITVRFVGGGHRRRLRNVDFMRKEGGFQDVIRIEYDPGRTAHIALIKSRDPNAIQPYSYIVAPDGLRAGHVVASFRAGIPKDLVPGYVDEFDRRKTTKEPVELQTQVSAASAQSLAVSLLRQITVQPGNVVPLRLIPPGTLIHNLCLRPNGRAQLVRAAGTFAQVVAHQETGNYALIKLQSGEIRKIHARCCATIGKVSNGLHNQENLGKAGRNRWLGRRPHVRGMAQNAVDHPHGGGRGKSKGGKHPQSPWGWLTKGKRTRKPGPLGPRGNNKMVVQDRPRGKEKREGASAKP
ncbi:mitochondrial ribosomal protein subunit L2 [Exidia glandulosa HHB12029]|uniref:Large ribosomal subunit protein uL2m n=1 Tax=Exidia glandulosa HHB12029 TaxID=1314781 RepID=A0A165MAK2_EXIGL|nr:mitochondrial ribosomal protein subunit L2 [Exidia glandulosa HHB12029]